MIKKTSLITLLIVLITNSVFPQMEKHPGFVFPHYIGYVNDFEKIFTEDQVKELEFIISNHEKETSNEIAIVTIDSISPYQNLFNYSFDLANYWGIGKKNKNNGIAVIFGKRMRQIRIQIGLGLEEKLTDPEAKHILDNVIIPEFKKDNFYLGIKNGVIEIINEIK